VESQLEATIRLSLLANVSSAKAAALIVEAWGNAPELCCAEGAVSLLAWGNAPGLVKSEPPALKARFTKDYLSSQRSFGKWINQPLTSVLSPQAGRGAVLYETFGLES
jgi:hypothetical protein